jgi:hypothetical protein
MEPDDLDRRLEDYEVDRVNTGFRILDTIFFAIVFSLLETVMGALVIFQLGYSLVTERPPSKRVRDLGNRLSAFTYQILRYLTHNSGERPFPFSDFPQAIEGGEWPYPRRSRRAASPEDDDFLDERESAEPR